MLKKKVTYEDFNGNQVTDEFHFHLSKAELIEMEAGTSGGYADYLQRIVDADDGAQIINEFKKLLLQSIGKVSEDGKRFVKNDTIQQEFMESPAYSELFMELATDAGAAAEFVTAIIPKGLSEDVAKVAPAPDSPQAQRTIAESTPTERKKVMTRTQAEEMDHDEFVGKVKDGWVVQE